MAENDQQARHGWLQSVLVSVLVALLAGGTSPWWWADLKTALQGSASVDKHEPPLAAGPAAATEASHTKEPQPQTELQQVDQSRSLADSDMLATLGKVGVTFSVDRTAITAWLHDSNTPYPTIGAGLLELLKGKQLSRPVPLDGIVYDYQQAAGTEKTDRIDLARLKIAVLRRYNTEYGTDAKYFDELLQ